MMYSNIFRREAKFWHGADSYSRMYCACSSPHLKTNYLFTRRQCLLCSLWGTMVELHAVLSLCGKVLLVWGCRTRSWNSQLVLQKCKLFFLASEYLDLTLCALWIISSWLTEGPGMPSRSKKTACTPETVYQNAKSGRDGAPWQWDGLQVQQEKTVRTWSVFCFPLTNLVWLQVVGGL